MCDTSVAVRSATADGSVIFAKNSDRKANECQPLYLCPRQQHRPGSTVRCTHREIPQVPETFAVLGSRPYWMWGFEIGVSEHGVAIGNEAVYGREGHEDDGLLGMDYIRLGLERGRTAHAALNVIVELLERYGQGGVADIVEPRSYHNSFIIADPTEAWVLETAGRYWVAERVKGRRAISNCYTIGAEWDEASKDLIDHAVARGWWKAGEDFNFARAYGDPSRDVRSGQCRFARATAALGAEPRLTAPDLMSVLRDHAGTMLDESGQAVATPICMHETPPRVGATAASMVVHLRPGQGAPANALIWHSFGSPCLSGFHPLYLTGDGIHSELSIGGAAFDPESPWWLNERIQRRADAYPALRPLVQSTWRDVERTAFAEVVQAEERALRLGAAAGHDELRRVSAAQVAAMLATLRELDRVTEREIEHLPAPSAFELAHWNSLNEPIGIELRPRDNVATAASGI